MPSVSVTRLRVRKWRYLPGFLWYTFRSQRQAGSLPGNVSIALLADAHRTFWTCSVWRDQTDLRGLMTGGPHMKVMRHLPEWCDEAALVRWQQDTAEPPSWPEAHRRLHQEGRRSKVYQPSPAHERFEIPAPRL